MLSHPLIQALGSPRQADHEFEARLHSDALSNKESSTGFPSVTPSTHVWTPPMLKVYSIPTVSTEQQYGTYLPHSVWSEKDFMALIIKGTSALVSVPSQCVRQVAPLPGEQGSNDLVLVFPIDHLIFKHPVRQLKGSVLPS